MHNDGGRNDHVTRRASVAIPTSQTRTFTTVKELRGNVSLHDRLHASSIYVRHAGRQSIEHFDRTDCRAMASFYVTHAGTENIEHFDRADCRAMASFYVTHAGRESIEHFDRIQTRLIASVSIQLTSQEIIDFD